MSYLIELAHLFCRNVNYEKQKSKRYSRRNIIIGPKVAGTKTARKFWA